jgi:16S rRNA (cytidine1402-2'-O)-methyltransferase
MSKKGKLYIIPSPIGNENSGAFSPQTIDTIKSLEHFLVERARTARRFVSMIGHPKEIRTLQFIELDKHSEYLIPGEAKDVLLSGNDMGLLSEAGLPCLADPGNLVVQWAHENGIIVKPIGGNSSIISALIASGLNGQQFTFHGYLPAKKEQLVPAIQNIERSSLKNNAAQIFIEAPYRNKQMVSSLLDCLSSKTKVCIACNLHTKEEYIKTQEVNNWKKATIPELHKKPCVFILQG